MNEDAKQSKAKQSKGFTLAEAIIVVLVIAVVAVVMMPSSPIKTFRARTLQTLNAVAEAKFLEALRQMFQADQLKQDNAADFITAAMDFINIVKVCTGENISDCFTGMNLSLIGPGGIDPNIRGIVLDNGAEILLVYDSFACDFADTPSDAELQECVWFEALTPANEDTVTDGSAASCGISVEELVLLGKEGKLDKDTIYWSNQQFAEGIVYTVSGKTGLAGFTGKNNGSTELKCFKISEEKEETP